MRLARVLYYRIKPRSSHLSQGWASARCGTVYVRHDAQMCPMLVLSFLRLRYGMQGMMQQ